MTLSAAAQQQIETQGYTFVREYAPDLTARAVFEAIGTVMPIAGLSDIQALSPRDQASAPPNVYSGTFGRAAFPLHSDLAHWYLPPRFVGLRCITGSNTVATRLLDGRVLARHFGETALRRTLVEPRRSLHGRRSLMSVFETNDRWGARLRWDSLFLVAASRASSVTFAQIKEFIDAARTEDAMLEAPGDTLLIDNWRMLHGRSKVPDGDVRLLERAYLGAIK